MKRSELVRHIAEVVGTPKGVVESVLAELEATIDGVHAGQNDNVQLKSGTFKARKVGAKTGSSFGKTWTKDAHVVVDFRPAPHLRGE